MPPQAYTLPKLHLGTKPAKETLRAEIIPTKPPPSNVLSKLSKFSDKSRDTSAPEELARSTGFSQKASIRRPVPITDEDSIAARTPARDDRLAIVEALEPGPYDHKPPFDDPHFQRLEPHSGITLRFVLLA